MNWNKGDILKGNYELGAIHPIIFLEGYSNDYFIGAMITSSPEYKKTKNILMRKEHFVEKYKIHFNNSHLVDAKLYKKLEWGPFKKTGELTLEGIKFVESIIHKKYPIVWEDYLKMKNFK